MDVELNRALNAAKILASAENFILCKRPLLPPVIYRCLINGSLKIWQFHEILVEFSEIGDVENTDFFKNIWKLLIPWVSSTAFLTRS